MHYPIIDIKSIEGPLSLSIQFGGLVPGWNLVLVCWEHEIMGHYMDDQFVAVWANPLGASVTAFVTTASTASTVAAAATTAITAAATAAATAIISSGHGR
jgi:hypothetical protein